MTWLAGFALFGVVAFYGIALFLIIQGDRQ